MTETTPSTIPAVIEYIAIHPKTELLGSLTEKEIADFKRDVILQAQGDPVMLSDDTPAIVAALMFAAVYNVATEVVLCQSNKAMVLLFDHQAVKPLRPKNVNEKIWTQILLEKEKDISTNDANRESTIDLQKIWQRAAEENDLISCVNYFIKSLADHLQPCATLRLRGTIPCLPLMAAIYVTRPYGQNIIYTDADLRSVTLFS